TNETSVTGFGPRHARPCRAPMRPPIRPYPRRFAMTTRRDFIVTAGLAATGITLAPLAACAQQLPDPTVVREKPTGAIAGITPLGGTLLTRAIPSTGEVLPAIGVGTSGSYEVAP